MRKNGRFLVGLVGVATAVTYLVWTGLSETTQYYLTPSELVAKVDADPSMHGLGIKVGARIVPGTYHKTAAGVHAFTVEDPEKLTVTIPVEYTGDLPDTFNDRPDMIVDAVLDGHYRNDGVFEATTVLTKCGSRYEASPEALKAG
jgi:cytochrome c-type biogenesis protein CcmE